ncbi:DUF4440 domain-containing protein [Virgibacillus sp. LDC1]|uniref:YybH family protein n=1 Tax=Paenibacillus TaxID=44249 RepID=UPI000C27E85E|nr:MULTISPECIES: DUF4440 domain-containing protein [Paenibacillus]MCV4235190.1 DUF4440 domain-containing protein [Virgibacillus sp. LDC1]MDL1160066.1 DUF4440 domain-containing protein [Yersinia pestis]MEC0253904.1 DUF4440 domain-containing protein [Paenibacillus lautus]MEC0307787.1 DUF4440 domain-containing protein [Paenibacillus lautus]PJN49389.1 hypothetical protein PAEVO_60980 [Paenibacillus sp. GM2FR]
MKPSIPAIRVWKPEDMNAAFADAYNSGDIDQVLALYEPDSIHVHSNGSLEIGIHSFRHTLEELLHLKGTMISTNLYCIPFENIAMMRARFTLQTTDPDGQPLVLQGHTSEIVRQQPDGSWLYIVDHPFGSDEVK